MTDEAHGEIEYRVATLAEVSFPKRLIELIVTPWEQEAMVEYRGRMIREVFSRGAFDGIDRRANRVRVNRDHDSRRIIGRAVAFHPSRDEGLVAELRIAQTELGDETLALADEECLDASAEFAVMAGGEQWPDRSSRRINKAWLGGIGLVPDPAFTDARVLAVRAAPDPALLPATPNADKARAIRAHVLYDSLSR